MIQKKLIISGLLWLTAGWLLAQTPPTLSGLDGSSVIYTEDDLAIPLANNIQLSSELPIVRATVQITENYVVGQDQLLFSNPEDVQGIFDEASGTLFLLSSSASAPGTAASFQQALRRVTYRNVDALNPQTDPRTVAFQATDESGQTSNGLTRSLEVVPRNDAPRLELPDSSPIAYAPGSGQNQVIFGDIAVSEPDDDLIESAQVTISEGFRDLEDRLLIINTGDDRITAVVSDNQSIVNLSGPAPAEAYQTAIRSVQFSNSPPAGVVATPGNRLISVTVDDGRGNSTAARFITLDSDGIPPVVGPLSKEATAGVNLTFTADEFAAQYRDPDGAPFSGIYVRSQPRYGTLLFRGTEVANSDIVGDGLLVEAAALNELTYLPPNDYLGEDDFLWNATDGTNFAANSASVTINVVLPPLTLALATPEPVTTPEDTELRLPPIELSFNREETLTTTLTVSNGVLSLPPAVVPLLSFSSGDGTEDASIVFSGTAAAVAYALTGLRYLPNENYNGSDALAVNVSAANAVNEQATLAITVAPNNDPLQLTNLETDPIVYTENDPPVSLTDQIVIENLDRDSDLQIASATVTITEGYVPGEDSLRFDNAFNISGEQQDNVLVLTGLNNVGVYQEVLRAVTYQNVSDDPSPIKTVSFMLTDEMDFTSNTVVRGINIQPVEDPPQLLGLEERPINYVVTNEFSTISNTVTAVDPDSEAISQVVVSFTEGYDPAVDSLYLDGFDNITVRWDDERGQLRLIGDNPPAVYTRALRAIRYQHRSDTRNENIRTLNLQALSGEEESEVVTRSIILITNDPPEVSEVTVDAVAGAPYSFTLADFADNYRDPDSSPVGDQLVEIRVTSLPTNGALLYQEDTLTQEDLENTANGYVVSAMDLAAGALQYVSRADFDGTDTFGWNAFDGAEVADAGANVQINVQEALAITVLPDSVTLCSGDTDTLTVRVDSEVEEVIYAWSCSGSCAIVGPTDQPTVVVSPAETTTYTVTVSRADGTQRAEGVVVVQTEDCGEILLDVPNTFTPNADNQNDTWVIPNAAALPELTVEIFDRHGHSLYQSANYQNDWDGTYEGQPLPVGTYYYVITNAGSQTYKGALNILR